MKKTIVVVDDHVLIAKALQGIINNFAAFEVIYVCENGKDLINKFASNCKIPDIILLDISMPIMDGWDFMDNYAKIKPQLSKKITVYMVSSSINDEDIKRAKAIADITDYVVKPVSYDKLLELFQLAA